MIIDIPNTALAWLAHGERGASSEAIFSYLTGIPLSTRYCYPHDSGDLRRCRRLLKAVPQFEARIGEMRNVSPQWAALVDHWGELCDLADEDQSACYRRMCELLDGKRVRKERSE